MRRMDDVRHLFGGIDRDRLVHRFGPTADIWCDELPLLVDAVAREWGLTVVAPLPAGANSVVFSCLGDSTEPLVLKLTPGASATAQEAVALRAWASCRHVVSLVDADLERGALLLESVRPGVSLRDDTGGWSLDDVAPMLAELWTSDQIDPTGLPPLTARIELVFDLARRRLDRRPSLVDRFGRDVIDGSLALARALAGDGPVGLVHGDLHPGNVLRGGGGRGVVAIDPRPCWGDRASDAVDWVLSDIVDEQGLDLRIDRLGVLVPGVDRERVWAWCRAMAALVAAGMLARRSDDPVGEFLIAFARGMN